MDEYTAVGGINVAGPNDMGDNSPVDTIWEWDYSPEVIDLATEGV